MPAIGLRRSPHGVFDNSAAACRHIDVRPLTAALGAEIETADIRHLSDDAFEELRAALFRHRMIYIRRQRLTHDEHAAFTLRFGAFAADAFGSSKDSHPNVLPLIKEADVRTPLVFGGGWHTDSPFLPRPPAITTLRSVEVPPFGGDTAFADTALAYRTLSPTMQRMLDGLQVHMSSARVVAAMDGAPASVRSYSTDKVAANAMDGSLHPLVRVHPTTGEKALYVDDVYTVGIHGMTALESRPLIDFLVGHITQHEFACRLRWEPDMIVLWDNRLCLHLAMNDYDGYRRELYRTTVAPPDA